MGNPRTKIPESKLVKAMRELEGAIDKSDALEDADPEGGLSTEGEPLSDAAPSGRERTKKSRRPASRASSSGGSSSSDDSSSDASSISEMMSAKDDPPKKPKGKVSKAARASSSASASSSDDASSDDASSDDDRSETEKSFREMAEGDETVRKAVIVNSFLEALVDQISLAMYNMGRSVSKSLKGMEARLAASVDASVAKSFGNQQAFNMRLAKAIAAIGNTVQDDVLVLIKSLSDQPMVAPRGKAVLSKGEVNQPPWGGPQIVNADQRMLNGTDDYIAELSELPRETIESWLFKKSATNQIDPNIIIAWEADRYALESLPVQVRKALTNDLIK